MKKSLTIVIVITIIAIILIAVILCCTFINTEEYLKVISNEMGSYITYEGKDYFSYGQYGAQYAPEANETQYRLRPAPNTKKIGYTRNLYGKKFDAFLLNDTNDNVIVTYTGSNTSFLWINSEAPLPDIFVARICSIMIDDLNDDRTLVWEDGNKFITLKEILSEDCFINIKKLELEKLVCFQLADFKSLEFILGMYKSQSNIYLSVINDKNERIFYEINEQYKNLLV